MDSEQWVIAEPAGKTEADWSSASGSSGELPKFVEGEYQRMVELREQASEEGTEDATGAAGEQEEPGQPDAQALDEVVEGVGSADREDALIPQLEAHMTAILAVGGRDRDPEAAAAASRGLARRITGLARVRRQGQPDAP